MERKESAVKEWLMKKPDLRETSNDFDEIVEGVFLGSSSGARIAASSSKFAAVVNCADSNPITGTIDGVFVYDETWTKRSGYLGLEMSDGSLGPPISPFLDVGADFIQQQYQAGNGPVLVHCAAGKSRSAAVVVAFLVKHRGFSLIDALVLVREKRPRAYPQLKFWEELREWEASLCGLEVSSLPEECLQLHAERQQKGELETDEGKLLQLVGMGFGEAQALVALTDNRFDLQAAIASLLS